MLRGLRAGLFFMPGLLVNRVRCATEARNMDMKRLTRLPSLIATAGALVLAVGCGDDPTQLIEFPTAPALNTTASEDVTPPELVEFDFTPKTIDVTGGPAQVTVTVRSTDDLSGVSSCGMTFTNPSQTRSTGVGFRRISGNALDGVYERDLPFPQFSEPGIWLFVRVSCSDVAGNSVTLLEPDLISRGFPAELEVSVNNPPELTTDTDPVVVDAGQTANNTGTVSDAEGDVVTLSASVGEVTDEGDAEWSWSFDTSDGPAESQTVTITADDGEGGEAEVTFELTVNNVAPTVTEVTVPSEPVASDDQPVSASGTFTDPAGTEDETYTCTVDYGDESGPQEGTVDGTTCSGPPHTYEEAGSYTVTVEVTDKDGAPGSLPSETEIVIYDPAAFLVIDEESIDNGNEPNFFSDVDVNDDIADIGLRTQLPFFAANVGATITLHTGEVGDEGWFALKTIPDSWDTAGPTGDGLRNFVGNPVGSGLGSGSDPEALLDKIPDVTPLRATGLKLLEGSPVCAVVYDSDVSINYDPLDGSLKGDNLGTVAFQVLTVTELTGYSSSSLPSVDLEILDTDVVCGRKLNLFQDAPAPISSSEPSP